MTLGSHAEKEGGLPQLSRRNAALHWIYRERLQRLLHRPPLPLPTRKQPLAALLMTTRPWGSLTTQASP